MVYKAISRCLAMVEGTPDQLSFFCYGCNMTHSVNVGAGTGPRWGYNGNAEFPTFTPSILARTITAPDGRDEMTEEESSEYKAIYAQGGFEAAMKSRFALICHSFVTDGRIQYLGDCTHVLAGKTVDLPSWEEAYAWWQSR